MAGADPGRRRAHAAHVRQRAGGVGVGRRLGHSSLSVTQRYSHMSPRGLRAKAHAMRQAMTTAAEAEKGRER